MPYAPGITYDFTPIGRGIEGGLANFIGEIERQREQKKQLLQIDKAIQSMFKTDIGAELLRRHGIDQDEWKAASTKERLATFGGMMKSMALHQIASQMKSEEQKQQIDAATLADLEQKSAQTRAFPKVMSQLQSGITPETISKALGTPGIGPQAVEAIGTIADSIARLAPKPEKEVLGLGQIIELPTGDRFIGTGYGAPVHVPPQRQTAFTSEQLGKPIPVPGLEGTFIIPTSLNDANLVNSKGDPTDLTFAQREALYQKRAEYVQALGAPSFAALSDEAKNELRREIARIDMLLAPRKTDAAAPLPPARQGMGDLKKAELEKPAAGISKEPEAKGGTAEDQYERFQRWYKSRRK